MYVCTQTVTTDGWLSAAGGFEACHFDSPYEPSACMAKIKYSAYNALALPFATSLLHLNPLLLNRPPLRIAGMRHG
jgi:hypothetical protein